MNYWIHYLPVSDKENAGPRIIIFSFLLFFLSVVLFISNINFLLDASTPLIVNVSNFLMWGIIVAAFLYTKTEKRMRIITPIILSITIIVLFGGLSATGGLFSVDLVWAIFLILVAYLFSGIFSGIIFTILTLTGLSIYYYGEKVTLWSHGKNPLISEPDYVFSTLACVLVVLSALLFAFVKTLNTLQKKNKELTEARFDELAMMLEARSREIETLRNKLARDFHDQTGSRLVTLKTLASLLKQQSGEMPEEVQQKIILIEKNAGELFSQTRDFIWSIDSRNSSLDEIMLHLTDFGNSFFEPLRIDFNSDYNIKELRGYVVPVEHVMQLILIFKEAMTNAGKYGGCKNVELICLHDEGGCHITFRDDGKGFDKNGSGRKSGLKNMKERSNLIGADVTIDSILNQGTSITVFYSVEIIPIEILKTVT